MDDRKIIKPQKGPQEDFLRCPADGCVFGGSAFGGKSYAILIESLRYINDPHYTGIIFRRKSTEITTPGGLWDTAQNIYSSLNIKAEMTNHNLTATFPSGAKIKFSHLEHETNKFDHHGGQYCFIGFDELTTFTRSQFFYLLTRNRPADGCNKRPYWRATCNPDADSWVRELISWWIDDDTGYADKELSGILRHYTILDDQIIWVDAYWRDEGGLSPRSLTFIPSSIKDNPAGMKADPNYEANLRAQDNVTRERLLYGNWNISYRGGMFRQDWFRIVDVSPAGIKWVRYWDTAATELRKEGDDPDWTAGALCGMYQGVLYIKDVQRFRETPATTETLIRKAAEIDGHDVAVGIEEEKGASGKEVCSHYQRNVLRGFEVHPDPVHGDKITRAKPWCALAEHGNVCLIRGEWNRLFLSECGSFPLGKKDQVDSVSGAYAMLNWEQKVFPTYEHIHFRNFKIDFNAVKPGACQITTSLIYTEDTGVHGICTFWGRESRILRIYDEIYQPDPVAATLSVDITKRTIVPISGDNKIKARIIGNEKMFGGGHDWAYVLRKQGNIRIKRPKNYEQAASILICRSMFARGQIVVGTNAVNTDIQLRSWKTDAGKPEKGYPLCQALCLLIADLREQGALKQETELKPYSKRKQMMREKIIKQDNPLYPDKMSEYEYLTK